MCNLWIRSQTKIGLIKTNDICIRSVLHKKDIDDKGKSVWQIIANNEIVAEYCTKERALEVLGEIQKLLVGDFLVFTNTDFEEGLADYVKPYKTVAVQDKENLSPRVEFVHRDCIVYEMPQE